MSVVVPNRISSGKSLANVEVLLQGIQVDIFNSNGSFQATTYSNNPAWVIVDILRRAGWALTELDLTKFAASAAFCQELISTTDLNGVAIQVPRYQCNLVLTKRQSAAAVVRGIRVRSQSHASLRADRSVSNWCRRRRLPASSHLFRMVVLAWNS